MGVWEWVVEVEWKEEEEEVEVGDALPLSLVWWMRVEEWWMEGEW